MCWGCIWLESCKSSNAHSHAVFLCERRQGLGLLLILLKHPIKDVRTRFPSMLPFLGNLACFSSSSWVRGLWQSCWHRLSGCMALPQHGMRCPGWWKVSPPCTVYLACGASMGTIKLHFIPHTDMHYLHILLCFFFTLFSPFHLPILRSNIISSVKSPKPPSKAKGTIYVCSVATLLLATISPSVFPCHFVILSIRTWEYLVF